MKKTPHLGFIRAAVAATAALTLAAPLAAQQPPVARPRTPCRDCDTVRVPRQAPLAYSYSIQVANGEDEQVQRLRYAIVQRMMMERTIVQTRERLAKMMAAGDNDAETTELRRRLALELKRLTPQLTELKEKFSQLCKVLKMPDGYMGINFPPDLVRTTVDDKRGKLYHFLDYPEITVESGAPAARAGVRDGDIMIALDGLDLRDKELSFNAILKPGAKVVVKVRRDGDLKAHQMTVGRRPAGEDGDEECIQPTIDDNLSVTLFGESRVAVGGRVATARGVRPPQAADSVRIYRMVPPGALMPAMPPVPPMPAMPPMPPPSTVVRARGASMFAAGSLGPTFQGAEIHEMDANFRESLGIEEPGLLVINVVSGSRAEAQGLKSGDLLTRADDVPIESRNDLRRALNRARARELKLDVVRTETSGSKRIRLKRTVTLHW